MFSRCLIEAKLCFLEEDVGQIKFSRLLCVSPTISLKPDSDVYDDMPKDVQPGRNARSYVA